MSDDRIAELRRKLLNEHLAGLAIEIDATVGWELSLCESPIEKLMLLALRYMDVHGMAPEVCDAPTLPLATLFACEPRDYILRIYPQRVIRAAGKDYRADFLIVFKPHDAAAPFGIVIECDGHEFHERTKDQAQRDKSRDRDMIARGLTVMRFTGSEIYKDATAVADEVRVYLEGLESAHWRASRKDTGAAND